MRRFSQRNSLVTLSDINITPLLDLAFVLLIIFVITTPLLTQSLNLKLPSGGQKEKRPNNPRDVRTIEITKDGQYHLERKPITLSQIESTLVATYRSNPNLIVYLRADENSPMKHVAAVMEICQRHDLTRVSVRCDPRRRP
jgi:biopolymer transport protein ExbD